MADRHHTISKNRYRKCEFPFSFWVTIDTRKAIFRYFTKSTFTQKPGTCKCQNPSQTTHWRAWARSTRHPRPPPLKHARAWQVFDVTFCTFFASYHTPQRVWPQTNANFRLRVMISIVFHDKFASWRPTMYIPYNIHNFPYVNTYL